MSDTNGGNGGISLAGATFLVFLVLKLTHNIDWSWWWVTAPLWVPAGIVALLLIFAGIVAGLVKLLDNKADRKVAKARQVRLKAASNAGLRRR